MIPNLAIHMNRQVNAGYAFSVQNDMMVLFGDETAEGALARLEAEAAGVDEDKIEAADLFLYNRVPGRIWGANREYIASGRLDDLQSAFGCMQGLIRAAGDVSVPSAAENRPGSAVNVCAIFDNEEVGSRTKQGADSTFLEDVLRRVVFALGLTEEDYRRMTGTGFMVSADNAHAVHPLHPDKADLVNRPAMNAGPVVKFSANQKYTTDAVAAAIFRRICRKADVPCQTFYNNSDVPGGSTLGNISTSHVSMNTVDIGLPQLAMHSPYETAGVKDTEYLIRVMREFFLTDVYCREGEYRVQ
ncbi:MAG: M18 family aminopeptidase, partial [Lachnospiraceae bacterium]|nr:M18 family aminopeptidase [Lachnospiraceae bacterium]